MDERVVAFDGAGITSKYNGSNPKEGDPCHSLTTDSRNYLVIGIDHAITTGGNCTAQGPCVYENICPTEKASGVHGVCYGISRSALKGGNSSNGGIPIGDEVQPCITENGAAAIYHGKRKNYIIRRLTPLECGRLQGFPDWWTEGAEGSDSAIYKMWGNGIALPCAADVIGRLAKELEE